MYQITEWILIKFVNDSVCMHFTLSSTPPQKQTHFSNWNCFHTVVRGSGSTYLVPSWRICYSQPLNSSVHASQPVTSLWQQTVNPLNAELNPTCHLLALLGAHHFLHVSRIRVKKYSTLFYLLSTIWCTQCKQWVTGSEVYSCQNYLEIKFRFLSS